MVQKQKISFGPVQPLESAQYDLLGDIGRCLHIDDVQEAHAKGQLVPQWLRNSSVRLKQKVLWFAPGKSLDEHNEFGNSTFVINWERVVSKLGPNLYLIDQAIYNNRAYTRVVFTGNKYDGALSRVALKVHTSPMKHEFDSYYHVSSCQCKHSVGPHELQIAIEVSDVDAAWLLRNCSVRGNNHSSANTLMKHVITRQDGQQKKYVSYKCFKYNTAQNRECPNDFDRADSDALLTAMGLNTKAGDSQTSQLNIFSKDVTNRANKENSFAHVHLSSQKVTPQQNYVMNRPADIHGGGQQYRTPSVHEYPTPTSSTRTPNQQPLYSVNQPNSTKQNNSPLPNRTRITLIPQLDESRQHIDRVAQKVTPQQNYVMNRPADIHGRDQQYRTPSVHEYPTPTSSTRTPNQQPLYSVNQPNSKKQNNSPLPNRTRITLIPQLDESRQHIDRIPQAVVSHRSVITSAPGPVHSTHTATRNQDDCCSPECDPCFFCFCL